MILPKFRAIKKRVSKKKSHRARWEARYEKLRAAGIPLERVKNWVYLFGVKYGAPPYGCSQAKSICISCQDIVLTEEEYLSSKLCGSCVN